MTVADAAVRAALPAAAADVACAHCTLPVPSGLIDAGAQEQFCCGGCRTAFRIIHHPGLDTYHDTTGGRDDPVAAGRPLGRSSRNSITQRSASSTFVARRTDSRRSIYLEGVHCGACVWLVERVPLIVPGVARAELNVRRSLARVVWDDAAVSLSHVARTLDSLGYHPHPFRGLEVEAMRRREDRAMLARIGVAGAIAANVMLVAFALYSGQFGGMDGPYERFFRWVSLVLTTPAVFGPGRVFFAGAWASVRTRTLHMDLPIACALLLGWVRGTIEHHHGHRPDLLRRARDAHVCTARWPVPAAARAAGRKPTRAELLYSLSPSTARIVEARWDARGAGAGAAAWHDARRPRRRVIRR